MIGLDFWYGNKLEDITSADANFYPNEGVYRGNMYIGDRIIGDFVADSSVEIENVFKGIFG